MVRVLLRKRELRGLLAEFEKMSAQQLIPADLVTRARRFTSIVDGPSSQVALDDDESRVEARRTAASWPFHDFAHIGLVAGSVSHCVQESRVQKEKPFISVAPAPHSS